MAETNETREAFVFQPMLTCIGNKRKLVHHIRAIAEEVASALGKERLVMVDGFAGSTVVSRSLCDMAMRLHTNDLETYSYLMAQCFLCTPSPLEQVRIRTHIARMNTLAESGPHVEGVLCKMYAPHNTDDIQLGERCFYTRENALIVDTLRRYIAEEVEAELAPYCLAPLLTKASIHTNTAGVFKGFYKKGALGWFGGKGECALSRIKKPIRVEVPVWSDAPFSASCTRMDINELVRNLPDDIDLIYLDPPYNQHPYGSNYFMLNVIAENREPTEVSPVSGIPSNWQKSAYNTKRTALTAMLDLLRVCMQKAKYVLISYNNEGILRPEDWRDIFAQVDAEVKKYEVDYDTYKGSRNLRNRSNKVVEIMHLLRRR